MRQMLWVEAGGRAFSTSQIVQCSIQSSEEIPDFPTNELGMESGYEFASDASRTTFALAI